MWFASGQPLPALDVTLHAVRHAQVSSHGLQLPIILLYCICECCESEQASGLRFAQDTVWPLRSRQRPWHQAVNCVHAQPTLLSSIPVSDGMIVVMVKSCQHGCLSLSASPESLTVTERSHPERQLTCFGLPNGQTLKLIHLNYRSCLLGKGARDQKSRSHEHIKMLTLG